MKVKYRYLGVPAPALLMYELAREIGIIGNFARLQLSPSSVSQGHLAQISTAKIPAYDARTHSDVICVGVLSNRLPISVAHPLSSLSRMIKPKPPAHASVKHEGQTDMP